MSIKLLCRALYSNNREGIKKYSVSILLALIVWFIWGLYTYPDGCSVLYKYWQVSVTMTFGSIIAGATSEGGGAIAFPVFTKVLQIPASDAKVFSLAIQSVGMVAASLAIFMMRIKVLWRVIAWVSLGGVFGMLIGSLFLAPVLAPTFIRMLFTVLAVSLALTLIFLSAGFRLRYTEMPEIRVKEIGILLVVGVLGGVVSGLVGSGIDMICFSVLVLLFRVCESIATPTSVILMAVNSLIGVLLHLFVLDGINEQVQAYWLAAVPVVIIGAPLGAYFCSRMHHLHIRYLLIALIFIELLSSLWILAFDVTLIAFSVSMLMLFLSLMVWMSKVKTYVS